MKRSDIMLHLIQGRSGTGKTFYVRELLARLAKSGEDKLLYLIPEQCSFESETAFLKLVGPQLCGNIKVMSFTRLYDMVMRETGSISGTPIDDSVRRIIMSLALEDCADKLEMYKKQAAKPQLTELMLSAVKEFKMCGITSSDLREKSAKAFGTDLSQKLREAALITDVYNAYVERSYIDPLDNNARLEKRLKEVNFFDGYTVVADSFSGFTAQEQRILDLILEQSKDFYITLCMESESEDELFFTVNRTRGRIISSARRLSIDVASPIILKENKRIVSADILALESGIYRCGAKPSDSPANDAEIFAARDIFEECGYIAEQISRLALGGECRCKDIAVVCRSSDKYKGILDAAFESRDIPYFMSKPEPIDAKPLMLLALSALEYVIAPSDIEKLFAIAKCGLVGLSDFETAELENYAYVWSLNGRQMSEKLKLNPKGYGDMTDDSREQLEKLNETRDKLMAPLTALSQKVNECTSASEIAAAVYQLLIDYDVPSAIKNDSERGGYEAYSDEEIRIWDILMDLLNKTVLAIGDRPITVKRYYELLKMAVRSVDISNIPQTLDQVLVGTADSIRLSSPYAVFVIGCVNGEFPHDPVSGGIFSDSERRSLITMELPVYDAAAELYLQEKFLVYTAVSAPKNKLFVSYCFSDLSGSPLNKSSIVAETERLLPNVKILRASEMSLIDRIRSEKSAFEAYALTYHTGGAVNRALKKYFSSKPEYKSRLEALERAANIPKASIKSRNTATALFGANKRLSASQVESFYLCHFKYFCTYGLRLKERKKAEIGAIEYGSLVHYLLENVLKVYKENNYERLSDSELEKLLDELLQSYAKEKLGGEEGKSDRFIHLYYRLKHSIQSLMNRAEDELGQSEFKPVDFELEVGGEGGIPAYVLTDGSGNKVEIRGKVDRVDVMRTDKASYVRIIDYKTGSKEFKISDVLYGLNMQMLIYLSAIMKNDSKKYGDFLRPGGILYMPSTVTSVTVSPGASEDEIQKEHDKKLRMNGLILDEPQVIKGMEDDMGGRYIPVSADKSGKTSKKSEASVISLEQLDMIFNKVDKKIVEMSDSLNDGDISAKPVTGAYNACAWCAFGAVCGVKNGSGGICVSRHDKAEVMELLRKEEEGEQNG